MATYGDISPRTAAKAMKPLLERTLPDLVYEMWGQSKVLNQNETKSVNFRRYEALEVNVANRTPTEGVTPASQSLTYTDYPATLKQLIGIVELTDVVLDTHEDPVLMEVMDLLGEQAAQTIERDRIEIMQAGSNVYYANGTARNQVNTVLTRDLQRRATRAMRGQNAGRHTKVVRSTANWGTQALQPAYVGIVHTDAEDVIRDMDGFKDAIDYGSASAFPNEIGSVEGIRYFSTTLQYPFADAGGLTGAMISTTGTNADVYTCIYLGKNAYGNVPLKGKASIVPMISNPKPSDSDPAAQRGHAAWKAMQTTVILNDLWMARVEFSVPQ